MIDHFVNSEVQYKVKGIVSLVTRRFII